MTFVNILVNMSSKAEYIQLRIDPALKERFFSLAKDKGLSPSELLRNLIKSEVENNGIDGIRDRQQDLKFHVLTMLKFLRKIAYAKSKKEITEGYEKLALDECLSQEISLKWHEQHEENKKTGIDDWERISRMIRAEEEEVFL